MKEMDGITFQTAVNGDPSELDNAEYNILINSIKTELYEISTMKSKQRIAALELIKPPNMTNYEVKFLLLPEK